jgi:small redox-active disulfide protein 2
MKHIKVLGPGCNRCTMTVSMIEDAARFLGVEVEVEKVTDMAEIARNRIMSTPGILIDGKLVHAGGLPKADAIAGWLKS